MTHDTQTSPARARALPLAGAAGGPLAGDALQLRRALVELQRAYASRARERICCHDISVTQCWALEALVRKGALTLNELAAELYLEKSTASRVVDALERKGYLRRTRHETDARALSLRITAEGERLYARIEAELLERERRLLSDFDPEVRTALVELIGRLAEAVSSGLQRGGGRCCSVD